MTKLLKDLVGGIQYTSSWEIWAELIDGKFAVDSVAEYGQRQNRNGMRDGLELFANGEKIGDHYTTWEGDFDLRDWEDEAEDIKLLYRSEATEKEVEDGDNQLSYKDWFKKNEDREDVAAIIEKAKEKWHNLNAEMSDEWLLELISEMNESLEA